MDAGARSLACAAALVDELVRRGVRHACLSPGSRSTPVALALARHPKIRLQVHLDERSSGFFALGIAKMTGAPTIVACTSGTAAAELFPAVVEASQSRVPLVVLTADRPPRVRGTGANQTIDQVELYGRYARLYLETPVAGSDDADPEAWAAIARKALAAAAAPLPGPVHVNVPVDEPLVPLGEPGFGEPGLADRAVAAVRDALPKEATTPHAVESAPGIAAADLVRAGRELDGERGVIVVGSTPSAPIAVLELAERLGWPVVAEPQSGLRIPLRALAAGQHLISCERWVEGMRPDVILQIGATPTTRTTQAFVASAHRLVVVDSFHLDPDPERHAAWKLGADPDTLAAALLTVVPTHPAPGSAAWGASWRHADAAARDAVDRLLDSWDDPFEGRVARDVAAWIPDGGTLFVGNSMPVRDLDAFMSPRDGLRILANRGASGIDGLVSTALGIAAASGPTVALIGDLSLLHDAGALLWNGGADLDAIFVVPNNDGGAVFSFLHQRELPEHERLFVTPRGLDLAALSGAAGAGHHRVERADELRSALALASSTGGIHLIEIPSDRARNVERHAEVQAAVDAALA